MPNPINGKRGAYLQPTRYGRDSSGLYNLFTWEGTKQEVLGNVPAIEALFGYWEMEESFTLAKCRLTARIPVSTTQQETPVDVWELFSNTVEKDVLEADNAVINSFTQADINQLRSFIQSPESAPGTITPFTAAAQAAGINQLYLEMTKGFRSLLVNAPVLRHTATASNGYQVPGSLTNVGRLISTATLKSQEAIRADIANNLPSGSSSQGNYNYAWLKMYPVIRGAAFQKTQVEQEWHYGLWITTPAFYGAVL
jgi:hypothetical protein